MQEIAAKLEQLGASQSNLDEIQRFVHRHSEKRIFNFLRNAPPLLLSLDKKLRDRASREGKTLNLPILGSTQPLNGHNTQDLVRNLTKFLFVKANLDCTAPEPLVRKAPIHYTVVLPIAHPIVGAEY